MSLPDTHSTPAPAPERGALLYRWQALIWWLLSVLAVVLIPSFVKFHRPAWNLGAENEFQVLAAGMAVLCAALAFETVAQIGPRILQLIKGLIFTLIAFGAAAALVMRSGAPLSRLTFGISCAVAMLLMTLHVASQRHRWIAISGLAVLVFAVGLAGVRSQIKSRMEILHLTQPTEYYRVSTDVYPVTYRTPVESAGGALATLGDLQILSTRQGNLYVIRELDDGQLRITPTELRVPVAIEEFEKYATYPTYGLRVTGLAAARNGNDAELYAVYDAWNRAKNCFTTNVSKLHLTLTGESGVKAAGQWVPVYESKPCLEATTGYDAVQTGGRLVIRADGGLLLSLGDHGINGLNGLSLAEHQDNDYGKVLQLNADGSEPRVFTIGHRNPQGLTLGPDGNVWETEHGPQGGDEINLLVAGGDYGWPSVSYGTDYGHFVWPANPDAHDHGSRSEPVLAFVPSIGTSNLVVAHSKRFPAWEGDLIVSSLKAETLYRVRLRDTRAIYAEPIEIGHRIRDLVWNSAGDLILWTDDGFVIRATPAARETAYDQCSGCHEPRGQMPALGPPLRSILGNKVADHFEFGYSPALRALGGTWTEERLDEFLRDPGAYAPGTTMTFRGIPDDAERAKVIEFLKAYE